MIRKLFTILIVALLLTGCRSDEPFGFDAGDGSTTLELLVPDTRMSRSTRAERGGETRVSGQYATDENEANISSLHFVAFFDNKDGERCHYYKKLSDLTPNKTKGIYSTYTLRLNPTEGDAYKYDYYLFANFTPDDILTDLKSTSLTSAQTEALEGKVKDLRVPINGSGSPAKPGTLPMTWKAVNQTVVANTVNKLTANLRFAVAKVRVTLIYNNAFGGSAYLGITPSTTLGKVNAYNLYKDSKAFVAFSGDEADGTGTLVSEQRKNVYTFYGFRPLPAVNGKSITDYTDEEAYIAALVNWYNDSQDTSKDPLVQGDPFDAVSASVAAAHNNQYTFQTISYLPEFFAKSSSAATTLTLNMTKGKAADNTSEECPFNIIPGTVSDDNYTLQRGHFYDIIGYVTPAGDVEFKLIAKSLWNPGILNVALAGTTYLDVAQTEITQKISGENSYYLKYSTDAPVITFESQKDTSNKNYFSLSVYTDPDTEEKSIEVSINPESNATGTVTDKYFYVIAGNIKKKIIVKEADYSTFLRLTPTTRSLAIPKIINEAEYPVYFNWVTNQPNLALSLSSVSSTIAGKADAMTITFEQLDESGNWSAIDGMSELPLSVKGYKPAVNVTLPQQGRIVVNIKNPANPEYYTIENVITIKAVTSEITSGRFATLTVTPNPTKYRIWFKDEGWGTWSNPHVYAYQALEVWHPTQNKSISLMDTQGLLDWVEYSFTGNMAFNGLKPQGGSVSAAAFSYVVTDGDSESWEVDNYIKDDYKPTDNNNILKNNFQVWEKDAGHPENYGYLYSQNVELMSGWRSGEDGYPIHCGDCDEIKINPVWPGVGMKKATNGWWYVDLPLLAKPGKTLIMFADGHGGSETNRYPKDKVPGILLPNYTDREAWYVLKESLVDTDGNEFTDDFPGTGSKPEPIVENTYYVIRWKNDWTYNHLHFWASDNSIGDIFGAWNSDEAKGVNIGSYYYVYGRFSKFKNGSLDLNSKHKYKLYENDGNQGGERDFKASNAKSINDTDIPQSIKDRIGSGYTIYGFEITER